MYGRVKPRISDTRQLLKAKPALKISNLKPMKWWQNLRKNPLARFGAVVLLIFYTVAFFAEFVAPYDPYDSQLNGSLLPPTQIYLSTREGQFIGPHIYPTTQGPVDANTGAREVIVDWQKPSAVGLFVKEIGRASCRERV